MTHDGGGIEENERDLFDGYFTGCNVASVRDYIAAHNRSYVGLSLAKKLGDLVKTNPLGKVGLDLLHSQLVPFFFHTTRILSHHLFPYY